MTAPTLPDPSPKDALSEGAPAGNAAASDGGRVVKDGADDIRAHGSDPRPGAAQPTDDFNASGRTRRFMPRPEALSVADLAVGRGGVTILACVQFTVAPGAALILRGPNGSGKTTLLRTLAGLQPALAGTMTPGPEAIAYASHADGLKATLTVAENLRFWARLHGHGDIAPALDAFGLGPLSGRAAGELSAGQKRRLGLARLATTRRPIWLLDEPTVSLDTATVARFAEIVRAHLHGGGIAVIATHIDLGLPEAALLDIGAHVASRRPDDAPARGAGMADAGFDAEDGAAFR